MIFSEGNHIQQIIEGKKTETRRASNRYIVGKSYAIQPKRTAKGIPEGRILITDVKVEHNNAYEVPLSWHSAEAEGGYFPNDYEILYEKINDPDWKIRYAYRFRFEPSPSALESKELKE